MHRTHINRGAWLAIALITSLLLAGCQRGSEATDANEDAAHRFSFMRVAHVVVRVDTATGQVWFVPVTGDGGFTPLGATPNAEDQPTKFGRFVVYSLSAGRGAQQRRDAPASLLRIDRATGYGWTVEVQDGAQWTAIAEPDGRSPGAPGQPADRFAASAPSRSASEPVSVTSPAPAPGGANKEVELRVVPREVLASAPGDEEENLKVVVDALRKEGLPVAIKAWAAAQLGQMDPERAVPPLLEALESEHPEVVIAAIESLQQTRDASTIPMILKLKQHPDARVRAAVDSVVKEVR